MIVWSVIFLRQGDEDIYVFDDLILDLAGRWTGNCGNCQLVPLWLGVDA